MTHTVAVDFGGTNIRSAYFRSEKPAPERQVKIPSEAESGPEAVIQRLISAIQQVSPEDGDGLRVGIGCPGPLNPTSGIVFKAPNLPGWKDIPLKARLEEQLNCPVYLGNDANVAALGEWKFGAGKGSAHMIYLTISTGIGGGVIINNQLLLGANGLAGELGHITVQPGGKLCGCGLEGHIEALASGTAIGRNATAKIRAGADTALRQVFEEQGAVDSVQVGAAARSGDAFAQEAIHEAARLIGHLLSDLAHLFNPQTYVLGGGVSQLGDLLFEPVRAAFCANVMDPAYSDDVQILPAALGDDAGLVGAMVLANQG